MNSFPEKTRRTARPFDFVWARRSRRSFRLLVAATVFFTIALWFSEGYLRYDRSETQYRMALTLHPAQARPILRTVVRRETQNKETPSSLYMEALAQVEEPEQMLEAYTKAYQVNPRKTSLLLNYGCRLYFRGKYEEARERFREAGANPPHNALPRYLEAAALAATLEPDDEMNDLMALLTRANISGDPMLFPEPLWHFSLPRRGNRYDTIRRSIAGCMTEPLRKCADIVCRRAGEHIAREVLGDWDNRLEKVQVMGARMMGAKKGDSTPTMVQMKAALEIQQQALALRGEWSKIAGGVVDPEINSAMLRINEARAAIETFEDARQSAVKSHHARLWVPVQLLLITSTLFFTLYAVAFFLHKAGSAGKRLRALPHIPVAVILPLAGFSIILLLLLYLAVANHYGFTSFLDVLLPVLWTGTVGIMLLVGILYPLFQIKSGLEKGSLPVRNGSIQCTETAEIYKQVTLRRRIGIYGCLLRRYMGVLSGGLLIMICVWGIAYRIIFAAYPFQLQLLSTGLENEAQNLIAAIQEHLKDLVS